MSQVSQVSETLGTSETSETPETFKKSETSETKSSSLDMYGSRGQCQGIDTSSKVYYVFIAEVFQKGLKIDKHRYLI